MYFDNIYFGKADAPAAPAAPTTAPTAPTAAAADVVSLYSDAAGYTTTAGFDLPYWGQGKMLADATIGTNHVLKGDQFTYQGFEFAAVNATAKGLGKLHMDIWSQDATKVRVYVISKKAGGGAEDTDYVEVTPTAGAWKGVDIDLSQFPKIDPTQIFQVKLDTALGGASKVMYFDNIYFGKADAPSAAPTAPTTNVADVKSLFSDSYTPAVESSWSTTWDSVTGPESVSLGGNAVKKYTNLDFLGIEPTSTLNVANMDTFHIDVWRSNAAADFKIKLVDFGADGAYAGGDDKEHEIIFNAANNNAVAANEWVSLDIPLSQFSGMSTKEHFAQLVIGSTIDGKASGESLWIDNVYFHNVMP